MFKTKTKSFYISEVFKFERGQRLIKLDQLKGEIPYISSTMLNNGVDSLISEHSVNRKTRKKPKVFENALTIANSGSVGSVFYHPYKFIASDHVTVLKLKERELDEKIALLLKVLLEQKSTQYSYNREISNVRMEAEKIILPVKEDESIDWQYMHSFIDLETEIAKIVQEYENITVNDDSSKIDTSDWDWWKIEELFEIKRGKGIVKQSREIGNIPYISAKNNNNGLEQLVNTDDCIYQNVLGWVNDGDGGVGYCFYHPYKFRPSNHITVLIPKSFTLNEQLGLFISSIITLENEKHSRGFSINNYRANKTRIKLPTIYKEGLKIINYEWIENYIKGLIVSRKPNIDAQTTIRYNSDINKTD